MKYKNFDYLKNTFWCVPDRSTTALGYDETPLRVKKSVQVVWHITNIINNEYIVGKCYSKFDDYSISNINAMINKDGTITMMFIDKEKKTNIFSTGTLFHINEITPPFPYEKSYKKMGLNHVFQMQVNLPVYLNRLQVPNTYLLHNAYMVQATPQTDIWYDLPTTNNSVPDFIAEAEKSVK